MLISLLDKLISRIFNVNCLATIFRTLSFENRNIYGSIYLREIKKNFFQISASLEEEKRNRE